MEIEKLVLELEDDTVTLYGVATWRYDEKNRTLKIFFDQNWKKYCSREKFEETCIHEIVEADVAYAISKIRRCKCSAIQKDNKIKGLNRYARCLTHIGHPSVLKQYGLCHLLTNLSLDKFADGGWLFIFSELYKNQNA